MTLYKLQAFLNNPEILTPKVTGQHLAVLGGIQTRTALKSLQAEEHKKHTLQAHRQGSPSTSKTIMGSRIPNHRKEGVTSKKLLSKARGEVIQEKRGIGMQAKGNRKVSCHFCQL